MVSRPVSPEYLKAGEDYLRALEKLGMRPNFLGWGWERSAEQWQLVLVTSIVDAGGPLALNKLLFKAYNAEATPKTISPFIVRIFSPELVGNHLSLVGSKDMVDNAKGKDKFGNLKIMAGPDGKPIKVENVQATFLGIDFEQINSYRIHHPSAVVKYHARQQEWQRFKRNVEKIAACRCRHLGPP
jgi:hypothetical protein